MKIIGKKQILKRLLLISLTAIPLLANASTQMKVFINGYESQYNDEVIGGIHYDSINYQLIKLIDKDTYLNRAIIERDADNNYAIGYKTSNNNRNFENVLVSVMKGNFNGITDLTIDSSEVVPKSKLLLFFSKNIPVINYINKCVDGDFKSHYTVDGGVLSADINAGSKVALKFKINLESHSVISFETIGLTCTTSLVDDYKGMLDLTKLSPIVGALASSKLTNPSV